MKILKPLFFIICIGLLACNGFSNKKAPLYKIPEAPKNILTPVLQNQFNTGVDFTAAGKTIANWRLEMNFDDSIKFVTQNGLSFTIPAMRPEIMPDSSLVFTSAISLGKVIIKIGAGNCNNVQTFNEALARKCIVTIGSITYNGCGQFLFNKELEGKWELQQYKAEKITKANFKNGIPYLKFTILNNKLTGFDGCNTISGAAEIQGKRIKFSSIASTKKLCNQILLPNLFSILENQLTGYKVVNELLYLYLIDDSVLILKKSV